MTIPAVRIAFVALFFGAAPLSAQVPSPLPQLVPLAPVARAAHVPVYPYQPLPFASFPEIAQDSAVGTGALVFGGIIGGGLGMVVGAAAGAGLEVLLTADCYDFCGLGGGFVGAGIGETLGMAFGVHAANDQRGNFAAAVVGPLGVLLSTVAVGAFFGDLSVPSAFVIGIPVLQLATSIGGERAAEKKKREARK